VDISLLDANKSDIIAFLDNGAMAPARYARATVHFGATNLTDSFWQEYMVGPLSSANSTKTKVELLTFPFNSSPPGKTKIHPVFSLTDGAAFVTKVSAEVEDITKELFNGVSPTLYIKLKLMIIDHCRRHCWYSRWNTFLG